MGEFPASSSGRPIEAIADEYLALVPGPEKDDGPSHESYVGKPDMRMYDVADAVYDYSSFVWRGEGGEGVAPLRPIRHPAVTSAPPRVEERWSHLDERSSFHGGLSKEYGSLAVPYLYRNGGRALALTLVVPHASVPDLTTISYYRVEARRPGFLDERPAVGVWSFDLPRERAQAFLDDMKRTPNLGAVMFERSNVGKFLRAGNGTPAYGLRHYPAAIDACVVLDHEWVAGLSAQDLNRLYQDDPSLAYWTAFMSQLTSAFDQAGKGRTVAAPGIFAAPSSARSLGKDAGQVL